MSNFLKAQQQFAEVLLNASQINTSPTQNLLTDNLSEQLDHYCPEEKDARLSIYSNNVYYSLTIALKELYPSLVQILGDDFFSAMAKVFIQKNMPKQPHLTFFGDNFPLFLTKFEHTEQLLYLPDLSRLEFYRHCAYYAEDQSSISPDEASKIDLEDLCQSKVEFVSSLKLICSNYSIFSLWQKLEHDGLSGESSLNIETPENILIYRDTPENNFEINTFKLENDLANFLNLLQNDHSIEFALEKTISEHSNFDASAAISFVFANSLIHRLIV